MEITLPRADRLEMVALSAVAAPFLGFGASQTFGGHVPFMLGVALFLAWMGYTAIAAPLSPVKNA